MNIKVLITTCYFALDGACEYKVEENNFLLHIKGRTDNIFM